MWHNAISGGAELHKQHPDVCVWVLEAELHELVEIAKGTHV